MNNRLDFNEDIAVRCGLREAVLATHLWDTLWKDEESVYRFGRLWTRISQQMLAARLPFLTRDMVQVSLARLREDGIIKVGHFSDDRFDHTNWYAFTDVGMAMMEPETYA